MPANNFFENRQILAVFYFFIKIGKKFGKSCPNFPVSDHFLTKKRKIHFSEKLLTFFFAIQRLFYTPLLDRFYTRI